MMIDLHNHTPLCHHAEGSIEEFVQAALLQKIDVFGFSDHAPMNFDEDYRMSFSQMADYERDVLHVKEKYQDQIKILLAYEVDFLQGYIDERVLKRNVDYFIGSVHYLGSWGFDNPEFIGEYRTKNIDEVWERYFEAITAMAKSGLFDIVGHLDLIKVFNYLPKKDVRMIAKEAIKAIKGANMAIELNAAGFRKPVGEQYPSHPLLELMAEHDIPITFGSDAHAVDHIGFLQDDLRAIAKNYGYKKCATFESRDRILVNF
ncbi:histidinol-phosphatase [Sulfurospirillum diekertiae]|uniref:Histidinol-phosphatase n=1 Tax=Sulfurospirillum diekertiae TaxID=1854492 RepID=A0A6G9VQP5_9BACT|nr:histidinol-phosphatase [Sulfurospirillum diekertiae]QIR75190.1 histidinol-phosphatase [Sulfurospirillum diekertiae]QIR77857.1 histidinol-phosphatase [Sulfurospirillum diekertiae]